MLKISDSGWATISLKGKEVCDVSYVTDIPNDFLEGFIALLSKKTYYNGVVITAHLEPSNFYLVLSRGFFESNNYYEITACDSRFKTQRVDLGDVDYIKMANELIVDIESDLEDWAGFSSSTLGTTQEEVWEKLLINKDKLLKNIEKLKAAIDFAEGNR